MTSAKQISLISEDYKQVKPIDISAELPRHPTKVYGSRIFPTDYKRIVVHTTDWNTTPEELAEYDVGPNHISTSGCPGITYHELIMADGTIYHTLPFDKISWHVGIWNPSSIGIALMYRVSNAIGSDQYAPTDKALQSLQCRCGDICLELGIPPTGVCGHRELKGTGWFWFKGSKRLRKTCPGLQVDMDLLRKNIATYVQVRLKCTGLYSGQIDGLWGKKSKAAFKKSLKG